MRWIVIAFLWFTETAQANEWEALSQPGAIAIMRHALAPGTGDPTRVVIGDCATQRNLDDRGREQARAIGSAFRERNISFDVVQTSQWCRTRETAELLGLGPVVENPTFNSFFADFSTRDRQTEEAFRLVEANDVRLMIVTHQVNISALTGQSTRSGEVLIIQLEEGEVQVIGSILIQP